MLNDIEEIILFRLKKSTATVQSLCTFRVSENVAFNMLCTTIMFIKILLIVI